MDGVQILVARQSLGQATEPAMLRLQHDDRDTGVHARNQGLVVGYRRVHHDHLRGGHGGGTKGKGNDGRVQKFCIHGGATFLNLGRGDGG